MSRTDDSSGSSDFFSPISISFFQRHQAGGSSGTSSAERLPPLHDSSWIGARLSPIRSFDKETGGSDDDEDDDERHKALHDTLEAAPFVNANERTSLLVRNHSDQQPEQRGMNNNLSKIHPLWRSPPQEKDGDKTTWGRGATAAAVGNIFTLGNLLCTTSGLNLFAMGIYDFYEWYRLYRTNSGDNTISSSHAWSLPWLIPPRDTLVLFGALAPDRIVTTAGTATRPSYYTGILSSLCVSTSVVEWLLIVGAWRVLNISSKQRRKHTTPRVLTEPVPWHEFAAIFIGAALTGQLWMWTYDTTEYLVAGCVAWGTCGVLCAAGMARPLHRFELFSLATMLLLLSLFLRPYSSVFGTTGSAFFGWALGACGFVERVEHVMYPGNGNDIKGFRAITFLGTGFAVMILSLPVLSLALRS
jgi:hypothetical protein